MPKSKCSILVSSWACLADCENSPWYINKTRNTGPNFSYAETEGELNRWTMNICCSWTNLNVHMQAWTYWIFILQYNRADFSSLIYIRLLKKKKWLECREKENLLEIAWRFISFIESDWVSSSSLIDECSSISTWQIWDCTALPHLWWCWRRKKDAHKKLFFFVSSL